MAETDDHREIMLAAIETVRGWFAARADVYVTGNLMVYYVRGDARRHRSPDLMAVFGVPAGRRPVYKTWEEGRYPSFVLEITSKTTRREDLGPKMRLYRDTWRVTEYFLFDPLEEYLTPSFQALRLIDGVYAAVPPTADGRFPAETLGLTLERAGTDLLFRDAATGDEVLRPDRADARAARAETREAQTDARRARTAARAADVRAADAGREREAADARTADERAARLAADARTAAADARAAAFEAELARMRALLPPPGPEANRGD